MVTVEVDVCTLLLVGSIQEAVTWYVPETEAEISITPVVTLIESPPGVAEKEPLYRRANMSNSYSTSDFVNSCAKILIGPNSPSNLPSPFTPP